MAEKIERLALIGIGLIGSSIARGARQCGLADEIVVQSRRAETVDDRGAAQARRPLHDERGRGGRRTPISSSSRSRSAPAATVAEEIAPALKPGAIVSDVGSVKASVIRQMQPHLPDGVHFVPAHPVAGTEHSGPEAGFAELFHNRWSHPDAAARAPTRRRSSGCGPSGRRSARTSRSMAAEHHDMVLAITSHVPHLIAYNIVGTAAHLEEVTQSEVMKFAAGGFRDFTRIAASDPTMWRDVFLNNKQAVLEMLGRFTEDLTALQRAIRCGDGDALFDLFTRTRAIRRGIIEAGQETAAPDFGRPHERRASATRCGRRAADRTRSGRSWPRRATISSVSSLAGSPSRVVGLPKAKSPPATALPIFCQLAGSAAMKAGSASAPAIAKVILPSSDSFAHRP